MKKEEIQHLAQLSRIAILDAEARTFQSEIGSIIEYVSQIQALTETTTIKKVPGAVYNVLRDDVVTVRPGQYTEAIMRELPAREGNFMKVKKIITADE